MALDRVWLPISVEDHIEADGMVKIASGMPLGYISEKDHTIIFNFSKKTIPLLNELFKSYEGEKKNNRYMFRI